MKNNLKSLTILIYKFSIYYLLYTIFFQMFGLHNVGLQFVSRTTVITTMTFAVMLTLLLVVYGNFAIGKQKSKPIIYSTVVTAILTDIITYMQLMVMNTNAHNNTTFRIEQIDILLYVIIFQIIVIYVSAYIGNWLYFKLYAPDRVLIIKSYDADEITLNKIYHYLSGYKLQYEIVGIIDFESVEPLVFPKVNRIICVGISKVERGQLTDYCYKENISISFTPEINDIVELSGFEEVYDDVPLIVVETGGLSFEQKLCKRILDLLGSIFGLILSSPIWIMAAIAIKIEDGGKVFFRQERYTVHGRTFRVFKFRTMKENVANYSSIENDTRITRTGKVLRKIRMDELPQILNILKGDMSLVGPRPEMVENVHNYEEKFPEFRYRLKVKAGLTGIAQIEGKYNTSPRDKLLMDLVYIENYSVWMDIKLILRTITILFKKESTQAFEADE